MINQAVLFSKNEAYLIDFVRTLYKNNFKKIFIFCNKKIQVDKLNTFFEKIEISYTQSLNPLFIDNYKNFYSKLDDEFISINCDFFLADNYFYLKKYLSKKKNQFI